MMRGERRIKFPNACFSSTGKPLIHGLSSFSHHSFSLLSFPITPCCCVPPLSSCGSLQASLCILSRYLHFSLPCGSFLSPIPHHCSSPTPRVPHLLPYLLFFLSCALSPQPLPLLPLLNFPLPSRPCVTGLWGRWLPVHHQGDDHPHGELQLPCLRLWRPASDTCAAGEWSVVAHFLLTVVGEVWRKSFSFVCGTLLFPSEGNFLIAVKNS